MKLLLLTDLPPCANYTAGMVLAQMCKLLPVGSVACFCVLDPDIQNIEPDPDLAWLALEYAPKPNEYGLADGSLVHDAKSFVIEWARWKAATPTLLNLAADFARRQCVDVVWAALQGQTTVRLAGQLAQKLQMPLYTLVWDPLTWWLSAHRMDRWHRRLVLAEFEKAMRISRACATASYAMSQEYEARYGVRSVAVVASYDRAWAQSPVPHLRTDGSLVIGMAGQFYAEGEWHTLVRCLNRVNWEIAGRQVELLVLGHYMPQSSIPEGRCKFLGWQSQRDAIRILGTQADVLYCPYPFAQTMAEVTQLSFPGKLVSYLAAGRPILFHGPRDSGPARYLEQYRAGVVTPGSGLANVYNALYDLVTQPERYTALALNAQARFRADFTLERMRVLLLEYFGVSEQDLRPSLGAQLPFDRTGPAAQIPPRRVQRRPLRRIGYGVLGIARQTPLRPLANMAANAVGLYRRSLSWLGTRRLLKRPRRADLQQLLEEARRSHAVYVQEAERNASTLRQQLVEIAVQHAEAAASHELERREWRRAESSLREELDGSIAARQHEEALLRRQLDAIQGSVAEYQRSVADHQRSIAEHELSEAVLMQQLEASGRAYHALADIHRKLNDRFDTVASASLGKLSLVEQAFGRLEQRLRPDTVSQNDDGVRYLDLLESVLTGVASADPSISPWAPPGYSAEVRLLGRDWPEHALTMIGTVRMRNLRMLVETVLREKIAGDLIEAGVWRGGACIYMRAILAVNGVSDRTVWLADSFKGLPPPDPDRFPADTNDTHHTQSSLAVPIDEVRAGFAKFGLLDNQVRFLEGWFKDTLPTAAIEDIALLRLDGDMYESTWQTLETLYPKVSPGGFIIVDDYILVGCRAAVDDYRNLHGIESPLQEVDGAAVYWQKEKLEDIKSRKQAVRTSEVAHSAGGPMVALDAEFGDGQRHTGS